MFRRAAAFILASCAVAACNGTTGFTPDGYHSPRFPFSIAYGAPKEHVFASDDWLIDNFVLDGKGVPKRRKGGDEYRRELELQLMNGDKTSPTLDIFDLLLLHKRSDASIWVRSIPFSQRDENRTLRVVAEHYAESLSGAGFFATDLGRFRAKSNEYASHIVSGREATLAGLPAYDVTIELANVDQLRLDPKSRTAMIRVVFARTPFHYEESRDRPKGPLFPVMLMVGYVNNPTDFPAQAADFDKFLALIETGGVHGLVEALPAPAPSASAPVEQPAPSVIAPPVPAPSASAPR